MFKPYDWQEAVITAIVAALREKGTALVDMATGLGKTVVTAFAVNRFRPKRVLVLCHDTDILGESDKTFKEVCKGARVYFNPRDNAWKKAKFVFATFQMMRNHKELIPIDFFDLIIVDEAHHAKADTFEDVVRYFAGARLALTATKERMDGRSLEDLFGEPVVSIPLEDGIALKRLNDFEYRLMSDGLNAETLRALTTTVARGERFSMDDVNRRLFIEMRDEAIVARIRAAVGDRKTIVFCRNVHHANRIAELLGDGTEAYHSGLSKAVARDVLPRFRKGNTQFLVVVNKANEGVDVPDAEAVVFLRTTESTTIFLQQLGRSLRKLRGKRKTLVLDFVGSLERITMLQEFAQKIEERALEEAGEGEKRPRKSLVTVSGEGFEFNFGEQIVEALDLLSRLRRDFYPTWEEASAVALSRGLTDRKKYSKSYKQDPKLHASPPQFYGVSWAAFMQKKEKRSRAKIYPTAERAGIAARRRGLTTLATYLAGYQQDPKLPANIRTAYGISWKKFFRTERQSRYETVKEAAEAAHKLKLTTREVYWSGYKQDPRLRKDPARLYGVSWPEFFGRRSRTEPYPTWQEAAEAARKRGLTTQRLFYAGFSVDPRLRKDLRKTYGISWRTFMGKTTGKGIRKLR